MSFEQLDNERWQEEKKKKQLEDEKREQFWLEKELYRETSSLLEKLALEISEEFWLSIIEVKKLISGDTLNDLEWLKNHIWKTWEKIDISKLNSVIQDARESIATLSKKRRESLKNSLEETLFSPETHDFKINKKLFREETIQRWKNPQSMGDEFIGLGLWLIDSTEAVVLFTYALGKWILLTPYHLYLILTDQAKYDWFSHI